MAWLLSKPSVSSILVGANKVTQLEDNLGAAKIQLSPEELNELNELTAPVTPYPNWFAARVVDVPVRAALSGSAGAAAANN